MKKKIIYEQSFTEMYNKLPYWKRLFDNKNKASVYLEYNSISEIMFFI